MTNNTVVHCKSLGEKQEKLLLDTFSTQKEFQSVFNDEIEFKFIINL